jgi:hypothetical protein
MTHKEFIERIKSDFIGEKPALLISNLQSTKQSTHEYDPETYVFCEIITANYDRRHIIRISASRFDKNEIPSHISIDVMEIIFRSPSHPNIYKQQTAFKKIFSGYVTNNGEASEFSFTFLLGVLNNIDGFFK